MKYFSPWPARLFYPIRYASAKNDFLINTFAQRFLSRYLYRPVIVSVNIFPLMRGRLNMRSDLYHLDKGMMEYRSILWVVAFNILVASPILIYHISLRSDGLTPEFHSLYAKVLCEGTSWRWPSKISFVNISDYCCIWNFGVGYSHLWHLSCQNEGRVVCSVA